MSVLRKIEDMETFIVPISVISKPSPEDSIDYCIGNISNVDIRRLIKDPYKMIMLFVPQRSVFVVHLDILTRLMNQKQYVSDRIAIYAVPFDPTQSNYRDQMASIIESYFHQHIGLGEVWIPPTGNDIGTL